MGEKLLLDTHALIWWMLEPGSLSSAALAAISAPDNDIYFSPVSAIEIATKVRRKGMEYARPLSIKFAAQMRDQGFKELVVTSDHAEFAGGLSIENQDPWDRLLLAQAQLESMRLVSADSKFEPYAALRLW